MEYYNEYSAPGGQHGQAYAGAYQQAQHSGYQQPHGSYNPYLQQPQQQAYPQQQQQMQQYSFAGYPQGYDQGAAYQQAHDQSWQPPLPADHGAQPPLPADHGPQPPLPSEPPLPPDAAPPLPPPGEQPPLPPSSPPGPHPASYGAAGPAGLPGRQLGGQPTAQGQLQQPPPPLPPQSYQQQGQQYQQQGQQQYYPQGQYQMQPAPYQYPQPQQQGYQPYQQQPYQQQQQLPYQPQRQQPYPQQQPYQHVQPGHYGVGQQRHTQPPAAQAAAYASTGAPPRPSAAGPSPAPAPAAAQPLRAPKQDITQLLLPPGRAQRPKRLALLLRGLPGSGKSHMARLIREREVEQGGEAPRILSLDDYFVTEVEKEVEDEEPGGKKGRKRKVQSLEYSYEPEMEGVYQRSLFKAYQRTLDEGRFRFVVLDAPNIRVADFKDFWAAGQAAGYEVFVVEMAEADPQVCHARNQHGRLLADLYRLSAEYEPTPAVYSCLDPSGLLVKRVTSKASISDVEMGDDGGTSDAEQQLEEAEEGGAAGPSSSRWASLEDGSKGKGGRAKRAKLSADAGGRAGAGGSAAGPAASSGSSMGSGGSVASMRDADSSLNGLADGIDEMLGVGAGASGMSQLGSRRSGASSGGRTRGILLSGGSAGGSGSARKRVRWPDQMEEDDEANAGFRIGTESRQLETVYLVPGLGPPDDGLAHPHAASFADAVRAEHQVEANSFRNILLGGQRPHLPH